MGEFAKIDHLPAFVLFRNHTFYIVIFRRFFTGNDIKYNRSRLLLAMVCYFPDILSSLVISLQSAATLFRFLSYNETVLKKITPHFNLTNQLLLIHAATGIRRNKAPDQLHDMQLGHC